MKLKQIRLICALIIGIFLICTPANAQTSPLTLHLASADTTAFPAVTVRASAWGEDGLPLAGLQPNDFTLQEDGGAPLHPATVREDTDAPLRVALVLDVSGSMVGEPIADAQAAAARFLDRLSADDRVALVAFSSGVDPDSGSLNPARELPFSKDLDPMYDLIESLEAAGETHLYNAVAKAVRLFGDEATGHRAILLLSDGRNEPADVGDPNLPIELAQAANIPVFVIGLGNGIDEPYLRGLATETGGLFRAAPRSAELARLFDDMATLLKTQYILTYDSTLPADGQVHTLKVQLDTPDGSVNASIEIGPLPTSLPPTETPIPTNTPETIVVTATSEPVTASTEVPAVQDTPGVVGVPADNIQVQSEPEAPTEPGIPWGWLLAVTISLTLSIPIALRLRRKKPIEEVCAKCGKDVTNEPGACPVCGETKRLRKFPE